MDRFQVLTLESDAAWREALAGVDNTDLSASPAYCRVFEENGDGQAVCAHFQSDAGQVVYPVFRRSLSKLPFGTDRDRSKIDLVTPYGYGGMYAHCDQGSLGELMRSFRRQFSEYASDTGAVSEFIRFHPLIGNNELCNGLIDSIRHHNDNVVLDLSLSLDDMLAGCRQRIRSGIRQTERRGFRMERASPTRFMDEFVDLYGSAMKRRRNIGYLNFPPAFFRALFEHLAGNIELFVVQDGDEMLAAAVVLINGSTVDYFLAANKRNLDISYTSHFLLFEIARWAKQQGYENFHLGGGADSLLFFKSGFSKERRPYYVGTHIFDLPAYDRLLAAGQHAELIPDTVPEFFFPAYRAYRSPDADRALLDALAADEPNA